MNARGKTQKPNERRNGTPKIISQGRDKYHVWRKGKGGQRGKDRREIKKQREKGKKRGRRSHRGRNKSAHTTVSVANVGQEHRPKSDHPPA